MIYWRLVSETEPCILAAWINERVMIWVADAHPSTDRRTTGAAFGHIRKTGNKYRFVAEGYLGDWTITHWSPINEPLPA